MARETRVLSVRVPVELYDELKKFIEDSDPCEYLSQSKVVSIALREWLRLNGGDFK